jgi:poly-gamma-glutamate synthesis protein (capsule biosynthesis protein)
MRRITRISIVVLAVSLILLLCRPLSPPGLKPAAPRRPAVLVFTGDILLAGRAGDAIKKEGPAAPFAGVIDVLRSADLAVGNLECPLAVTGRPESKEYTFRARPEAAEALSAAGFDIMTLANNHTGDYGPGALVETLAALKKNGIAAVGAGRNRDDARRFILTTAGSPPIKIAILAFSNMQPTDFYAGRKRPGTNPAWPSQIKADVAAAHARARLVVVLFHWGEELSEIPSKSQRYLARVAVEAGADLVVGHHPHVLQGLEQRGNALIAYSLGNFLFPSGGSAKQTMILRYSAAQKGPARAELIPCEIEGFRPRIAAGQSRDKVMRHVGALSRPLGVQIAADGGVSIPLQTSLVDKAGRRP